MVIHDSEIIGLFYLTLMVMSSPRILFPFMFAVHIFPFLACLFQDFALSIKPFLITSARVIVFYCSVIVMPSLGLWPE